MDKNTWIKQEDWLTEQEFETIKDLSILLGETKVKMLLSFFFIWWEREKMNYKEPQQFKNAQKLAEEYIRKFNYKP